MTKPPNRAAACALLLTASLLGTLLAAPAAAFPPPNVGAFVTLSNPFNETQDLAMVYSPSGEGVAAWIETNGSTSSVWSARYRALSGWSAPSFHYGTTVGVGYLRQGADAQGNAVLLWVEFGGTQSVWLGGSDASGVVSASLRLRNVSVSFVGPPVMRVDSSGNAFAFWGEWDGANTSGWAAVIDSTGAVAGPTRIDGGSNAVFEKAVLPDASGGGATALWCDRRGTVANLTEARYTPAFGWSAPAIAVPNLSNGCSMMDAGIDGGGNITVLFFASLNRSLVLIRQPAGGPWEAPTPFFSSSGTTYVDVISLDVQSDGAAVATWRVWDFMDDSFSLFARVFTPETGWSATQQLTDRLFTPSGIVAAQAPGGSALVLFSPPSNSTYTLSLAQFTRGVGCAGWSAAVDSGLGNANYNYLATALSPSGGGHLLYRVYNGARWEARAAAVALARAPPLVVTTPADGVHVASATAFFSGTAPPNSTVAAAGSQTTAFADGTFSLGVPLLSGPNNITVTSTAAEPWPGCQDSVAVRVTFDDPVPGLLAALNTTRDQLNATASALASAAANFTAAQARVDALEASGNATQADLDAARAELAAANATIEGVKGDYAQVSASLNATADELARVKVQFPWLESNLTAVQASLADAVQALDEAQARVALLDAQQNQTSGLVRDTTAQNAALAAQVSVLSIVAFVALLAAIASMGLVLRQARGGGGGGGGAGGSGRKKESEVKRAEPASGKGDKGKGDAGGGSGPADHGG